MLARTFDVWIVCLGCLLEGDGVYSAADPKASNSQLGGRWTWRVHEISLAETQDDHEFYGDLMFWHLYLPLL